MSEPTQDEIARVRAYDKQQREEQFRRAVEVGRSQAAAHAERIRDALTGQRILTAQVEGMNPDGEISMRDGYLVLGLSSGQMLKVSVGGWHEPYLDVVIEDSAA